jgi:hypothetical protein
MEVLDAVICTGEEQRRVLVSLLDTIAWRVPALSCYTSTV